jgi:hypothetical protein
MGPSHVLKEIKYQVGSLLGRPRRENFLKLMPKESVGAEVGVFCGDYTKWILKMVRPARLHLIDAWWMMYGDCYPDWGAYTDFGRLETREAYRRVQRVTARYGRPGATEIHVGDSVALLSEFSDAYFDWVYLDTSHSYEDTRRELDVLREKVKPHGLITGDDWHEDPNHGHHGMCRAVREFCATHGWSVVLVDGFRQWCIKRD